MYKRASEANGRLTLPESTLTSCEGIAVLVIEGNPDIRAGLVLTLTDWRCRVLAAASLEQAEPLLYAAGFTPDLIMTGLLTHAPGRLAAMDRMFRFAATLGLTAPVIVVSGDGDPLSRAAAEARGWSFLLKPVTAETLRAAVLAAVCPAGLSAAHRSDALEP